MFALSDYRHAALFDQGLYQALDAIAPYLAAWKHTIHGKIEEGAFLKNREQISLGKGSLIEAGAYVVGPCIIGDNCTVRHGAYIRGNVITGDHCVIGHATEMKGAILLNHVHAAHFAYVGDSILGNQVNLGAGTRCANLRLDRKPIILHNFDGHERIDTGRKKLGALLGDGVQTGCNAVLNPGTVMEPDTLCFPCAVVSHTVSR